MSNVYKAPLTAAAIKAQARDFGADLVGIAQGAALNENPPNKANPRRPMDITEFDADRVIVLAKRASVGASRLSAWNDRHKLYNDELVLSQLEEASLDLVYWLEDQGYPALVVPVHHVDPTRYQGGPERHDANLLSADHAAVEAGLGTLGLNQQLLTPEFGPRVHLSVVMTSLEVAADQRRETALCQGPSCGRCLMSCPGDTVGHWDRDWAACDRFRSPYGFHHLSDYMISAVREEDKDKQIMMLRSRESADLFESVLRGGGIITGCRRCGEVCPVGDDYESSLGQWLDEIPEQTPEKRQRLETMTAAEENGERPAVYHEQARWIGALD